MTTRTILRPKPILVYPLDDKQAILDFVYHHFLVENNPPGADDTGQCLYNTPTGGCAIGCLLTPEVRARLKEDVTTIGLLLNRSSDWRCESIKKLFSTSIPSNFFSALQKMHDECVFKSEPEKFAPYFLENLILFARRWNLNIPAYFEPSEPSK
jgi:hypothetical protein